MPYNDPDPKKDTARIAVMHALRAGEIAKPSYCEMCFEECWPQAHHNDYNRPLKINWLCSSCHTDIHQYHGGIFIAFDMALAVESAMRLMLDP